jgi:hypothetical protein
VRIKREDHIKKTLEWANQGLFRPASIFNQGSQPGIAVPEGTQHDDVEMEDVSQVSAMAAAGGDS